MGWRGMCLEGKSSLGTEALTSRALPQDLAVGFGISERSSKCGSPRTLHLKPLQACKGLQQAESFLTPLATAGA